MEKMQFETHRIRFTISSDQREKSIEELRYGNWRLKRYFDDTPAKMSTSGSRRRRHKGAMSPALYGYWQHAKDLYRLLQSASSCTCRASHRAHLTLQQHQTDSNIEFNVLFTFTDNVTCQASSGWDFKQTMVFLESTGDHNAPSNLSATTPSGASNSSQTSRIHLSPGQPTDQSRGKKRVTWANSSKDRIPPPSRPPSPGPKIYDLCATIASLQPHTTHVGVLEEGHKKYAIQLPGQQQSRSTVLEHISLQQILTDSSRARLSRRQRYTIALAIASAYLQLHASPWLDKKWDKSNIKFLFDPMQSALFDEPRITRDLVTPQAQVHDDHSIGALGITLLELTFGDVLERYPLYSSSVPAGGATEWSDAMIAKQWCINQAFDEEEVFANVIHWCLQNSPVRGLKGRDKDREWRQQLFENVVDPLRTCCRETFGQP